jgi:hypothetical protein
VISVLHTSARLRLAGVVLAGALATLVAALAPVLQPVAAHSPNPMLGGLFAQNQALDYRWAGGGTPPTAIKAAINAAADDSNASRRSKAPLFAYASGATNTVYYGVDAQCGVNGLACFSRTAPTSFRMWLRENGHRYDWGTLRWCEMTGDPDGCYDAETITLDEFGHVLGLDHHVNYADDSDYTDAVVQTYSRTKPRAGWNAHVYGRCDIAALQQAYDVLTTSTLYSTCLDVPSTLALAASKTSVVAGSVVTYTATLKSAGTGRLSNNAVTGRTVVLQRRTASGWTDLQTMVSGSSGSYTTQVVTWSAMEVRALFREPSGEGLRGSASGAIAVTVSPGCVDRACPAGVGSQEVSR